MRRIKSFLIRLEKEGVWFRNEFRLLGLAQIEEYLIQFEIVHNKKHLTPVRYDMRHNCFHRDIVDKDGKHVGKRKEFKVANLEEAVKLSINDLICHWKSLLEKGGYGDLLSTLKSLPEKKMQRAQEYLVCLIQHPDKIDDVSDIVDLTLPTETLTLSDSVNVKLIRGTHEAKDQL